jgi:isochorismate pyruvate lyase
MTQRLPEDCGSMAELRVEIDQLDRQLIELIAKRTQYIDRAAVIKQGEKMPARITSRVEEVVDNVRKLAVENNLDPQIAETVWRDLIEWSIAKEEKVLGK